jgi:hypothetical protein
MMLHENPEPGQSPDSLINAMIEERFSLGFQRLLQSEKLGCGVHLRFSRVG